ncbi:MAG: EAL domain-containing protein [Candidatus Limnocylindrales bacterium]
MAPGIVPTRRAGTTRHPGPRPAVNPPYPAAEPRAAEPPAAEPSAVKPQHPAAEPPAAEPSAVEAADTAFLAAVFDTVAALLIVLDPDGRIVRFNRACERATGWSADEVRGLPFWELLLPADQISAVRAAFKELIRGTELGTHENHWLTRTGGRLLISWTNTTIVRDGAVAYIISTGIDITERRRTDEAMRAIEAVGDVLATEGPSPSALRQVVDHLADRFGYKLVSIYLAEAGRLHLAGQKGYDDPIVWFDEGRGVIGRALRERSAQLVLDVTVDPDYIALDPTIRSEICVPLIAGDELLGIVNVERPGEDGQLDERDLRLLQSVAERVATAVALGRKRVLLEVQAFHDSLTGLANRALFIDRTDHAIAVRSRAGGRPVAVIFLDLDDFKTVNDGMGHAAGDELLVQVARRMADALRPGDTIARLGGDEFAILLEDVGSVRDALDAADRITASLRAPFSVAGNPVSVLASAGVALGSTSAADLLRDADLAMYRAKRDGKARSAAFEPAMRAAAIARLDLERELRLSISRGDFPLVYQPVVDLGTGRTVAVEALVRWAHPTRGLLGPDDFMAAAEETGLIVPLGRRVIQDACRQARSWSELGWAPLPVSVNLSVRQVADPDLVADLRRAIADAGIDARWLSVEVTESILMGNVARAVETLAEIRSLGVRVALDDFGTGYSSLAYIKDLPVDIIKVDQSFVAGVDGAPDRAAIVETILRLGRLLGLTTIAEGVETEAERRTVRELGADLAQGYLFSRPLSAEDLERYLLRDEAPAA